jgi:CDP-paratose 2-epimerase
LKILITGGCGFVGSNLAVRLKQNNANYDIICLDNLKRRGSELNLERLRQNGIKFIHGDIRVASDFDEVGPIDLLIEAAAEPSVMAGINGGTEYLMDTNLNGTIHCLNYAVKYKAKFIFLSTSRVYPVATLESAKYEENETRFYWTDDQVIRGLGSKGISEDLPLDGYRSLYGTTKLTSELIIAEYNQMFDLNTIINRCGVLTGPYQMGKIDQGVVVLWAARHYWKGSLGYIGYGGLGKQVRDILHVDDLYHLIHYQINHIQALNGKTYNVGGGIECSLSLLELTSLCEKYSGNRITINQAKETRPADLRIYITDNTKVTKETGWKPSIMPEQILQEIFTWIKRDEAMLRSILA